MAPIFNPPDCLSKCPADFHGHEKIRHHDSKTDTKLQIPNPWDPMYGAFTYIYHKFQPNVGEHTWILWVRVVIQSLELCTKLHLDRTRDHSHRCSCGTLWVQNMRPPVQVQVHQSSCERCSPRSPGKMWSPPPHAENVRWCPWMSKNCRGFFQKVGVSVICHTNHSIHSGFSPQLLCFCFFRLQECT